MRNGNHQAVDERLNILRCPPGWRASTTYFLRKELRPAKPHIVAKLEVPARNARREVQALVGRCGIYQAGLQRDCRADGAIADVSAVFYDRGQQVPGRYIGPDDA